MYKPLFVVTVLGLLLAADAGCKEKKESETPEDEVADAEPKKSKGVSENNEEGNISSGGGEAPSGDAAPAQTDMDSAVAAEGAKKRPEVKEVCKKKTTGKGKNKKTEEICEMVDSNPKLTASLGIASLTKGFTWGMAPDAVISKLSESTAKYYDDQLKDTKNPMEQDRLRKERTAELNELKKGHVKFNASTKHKWGVSLIQYEFADDSGEEMVWIKEGTKLRKFYFFKDNGLWKIVYAFNKEKWPEKDYTGVVDNSFKKWFGVNPAAKTKQDPKTAAVLLRYHEWLGENNEKVRSFDLTEVHGIVMIAVIDGNAEAAIGERLPNMKGDHAFGGDVGDVLGGSDVMYDENGKIVEGKKAPESAAK